MQMEKDKNKFTPAPEDAKIVHLGSFGNKNKSKKKMPEEDNPVKPSPPEKLPLNENISTENKEE